MNLTDISGLVSSSVCGVSTAHKVVEVGEGSVRGSQFDMSSARFLAKEPSDPHRRPPDLYYAGQISYTLQADMYGLKRRRLGGLLAQLFAMFRIHVEPLSLL